MKTIENFSDRWNNLTVNMSTTVHQRIDAMHPIDIYIGANSFGQKEFLIMSKHEPDSVNKSKSISVEIRKRTDGDFIVIFTLLVPDQESVFINLVYDLIESSRNQINNYQGVLFVMDRYAMWQRLLEEGRDGLLSENAIKGLIGELLFLEESIVFGLNTKDAMTGWVGVQKGDRDFIFPDKWYEIKSTSPSSTRIKISSIEQLDTDENGELVVYFIEKSIASEPGSINLNKIVSRVRSLLNEDYLSLREYNDKLLKFGYIKRSDYEKVNFICRGKKRFLVDETFPRVRREEISPAICELSYDLSLNYLSNWEI